MKAHGSYLPQGTRVRYDGKGEPEYGIVIHCWINDEIQAYDCYIAFFGEQFPEGAPKYSPYILLTSLLTTGAQGGYYALFTWLPTYLKAERKLSVVGSGGYIAVVIIGSFIGLLVGAHLADRIGRRANSCSLRSAHSSLLLSTRSCLSLGFFAAGIFAGMGAFLTENFPTKIRALGQGFAYNFGRGVAALNPTFVGLLSATLPLGQSIGVFAAGACGLLIIAALLLAETKGRELTPE